MGDFPQRWEWVRDLEEGGQGPTFVVVRSDGSDSTEYVLKRLKNPKREDYFAREIQACETLSHPNVLKILEKGKTPKAKPYLITPFCEGGSLQGYRRFETPIEGLRFFLKLCAGVAHAHESGVVHLDIKPTNIFLRNGDPIVGDFGICFIEDGEYVMTSEGPRGSLYYCAPELRGPKITSETPIKTADVYSLGKVLHWIFSHEVRDGHEEDYAKSADNRLAELFPALPEFAFVDEVIEGAVQRNAFDRYHSGLPNAVKLHDRIQTIIDRIERGGRVLDLKKPIRCLFCAIGEYVPLAELPPLEKRLAPMNPLQNQYERPDIYKQLRDATEAKGFRGGSGGTGSTGPLVLTCQHCGNVQVFRFDLAAGAIKNWRP